MRLPYADVTRALGECQAARAIVLRGAGNDFCIGRDMQPPPAGAGVTPADVMREDAAMPSLPQGEALANAPLEEDGYVRVRAVLE